MTKIGVIGLGYAGAAICHALINDSLIDELYIYDLNKNLLMAQKNDLAQAAMINEKIVKVIPAEIKDLFSTDILINTASAKVTTSDRMAELTANKPLILDLFKNFIGYKGIIINITNPCEIITKLIVDATKIDPKRVLGSGTILDSIRLKWAISDIYNIDPNIIDAYAFGEHGVDLIYAFSNTTIAKKPFFTYLKEHNLSYDEETFKDAVVKAGSNIFKVKQRTEYGIANCINFIIRNIIKETKTILCIDAPTNYNGKLIYTARPVIVLQDGYLKDADFTFDEDEKHKYERVEAKFYQVLYLN